MARKKSVERHVHIGDIAVDTGTIVLGDPCNVGEVIDGIGAAFEGCHRSGKLNMGIGVMLPTGLGDGIYPVIAVYDDAIFSAADFGERIARIYVEFANPLRGAGCQQAFPHEWSERCWEGSLAKPELVVAKK